MQPTNISETVSKNGTKRGRPRIFPADLTNWARNQSESHTMRQAQNIFYRQAALNQLKDEPRCRWLCDPDAMMRGDAGAWKPTILSELGRILEPQDRLAVALQICAIQPKTKAGVALIRQWRLGSGKEPPDPMALTDELLRHFDDYLLRHPTTEYADVLSALENLGYLVFRNYFSEETADAC